MSSSLTDTDELVTIDHLRLALGHPDDEDDADKLQNICRSASLDTMAQVRPYLPDDVRLAGTAFHELAVQASLVLAQAMWYEHNFNLEQATHYRDLYDKKIKSLTKALKSERHGRDRAAYITVADPLERTYLPSERGMYIAREFI